MLVCLIACPHIADAARKSDADRKREARMQKMREERVKKQEEAKLKSDPRYYFDKEIKGNYVFESGKVYPARIVSGTVLSVADDTHLLIQGPPPKRYSSLRSIGANPLGPRDPDAHKKVWNDNPERIIAVVVDNTKEYVDGDKFSLDPVVAEGRYAYTSVAGAKKTVRSYQKSKYLTFEDYMKLRKAGHNFSEPKKR